MSSDASKKIKQVMGIVSSIGMDKTCVVKLKYKSKHPLLGKYINKESRMYVHDAENKASVGDQVLIRSVPPVSKTKKWILIEIIKKSSDQ